MSGSVTAFDRSFDITLERLYYSRLLKKEISYLTGRSRDSSVGIASSYGLDDRGFVVRVPVGSRRCPPNLLYNSL
jgi:hypothetical protein